MKETMRKLRKFLWLLVATIVLQACYPGDSIPISDLDTTSTLYDTNDFATAAPTSAAILWEVVQLKGDDGDDLDYDGGTDDEILNTTLDELVGLYGEASVWIISETSTPPDYDASKYPNVLIYVPSSGDPHPTVETLYAPSVVLRNKQITVVYPGYPWYGGGWGGYYPGYPGGCYYCGYPSYGSVTYQVGTVVLEMYDLRKIPEGGPVPADYDMSWIAIMRGMLGSNSGANSERAISGIQQAFRQSPYLK
jgi:hypothetical protein